MAEEDSILAKLKSSLWGADNKPTREQEREMERKTQTFGPSVRIPSGRQPRTRPMSSRHQKRMEERKKQRGKWVASETEQDNYYRDEEELAERKEAAKRYQARREVRRQSQYEADEYDLDDYNGGDDNERLLRHEQEEEQRRREEQEKELQNEERIRELRRQMFGDGEVEEVYVGSIKDSREKWHAFWAMIKAVWYFLFAFGALFIWSHNYDKRVCLQVTTANSLNQCVVYNATFKCVGLEVVACQDLCNPIRKAQGQSMGEGCMAELATVSGGTDTYTCMSQAQFELPQKSGGCLDEETCPNSDEGQITQATLFIGIFHLITMLVQVMTGYGLMQYAAWHHTDFETSLGTRMQRFIFMITKNGASLSQYLFVATCLAETYLLFIFFGVASACSNSVTSNGAVNEFPADVLKFAAGNLVFLLVLFCVGSYIRHKWILRGELFQPSFEDTIRIPYNLDCAIQSQQEAPKCCHNTCEGLGDCLKDCGVPRACYMSCVFVFDILTTPFLTIGRINGWIYKHRHWLGP